MAVVKIGHCKVKILYTSHEQVRNHMIIFIYLINEILLF